jgi:hypothetical protein
VVGFDAELGEGIANRRHGQGFAVRLLKAFGAISDDRLRPAPVHLAEGLEERRNHFAKAVPRRASG